MFALFLLLGAALLLTTGGSRPPSSGSSSSSSSVGLAMVAAASLISGLSGALTQRAMSRPGLRKANPFFFSAEMAVFGILFLILNLLTVHSDIQGEGGLFSNWTPIIIVPVLANVQLSN
jgi:drug/metabolite transporter (DMT)-like permease